MAAEPLEVRVARAEERTTHLLHVTGDSLVSKLRAMGADRWVPLPVGIALAALVGRLAWLVPARRRRARTWAAIVAPGAGDRLARRHLIELAVQQELFWRGDAAARVIFDGAEHLQAAQAAGRGVLVLFPHHGPVTHLIIALAHRAGRVYLGRRPNLAAGVVHGAEGRWVKVQRGFIEDAGGRLLTRGGTFDVLEALLRRGELVLLAWDRLGDRPLEYLGRTVGVRSGAEALAASTGCAVVPALCVRDRWRVRVRFWPAIEGDDVLQQVATTLEPAVLARLAQGNDPLARWLAGGPGNL